MTTAKKKKAEGNRILAERRLDEMTKEMEAEAKRNGVTKRDLLRALEQTRAVPGKRRARRG